MTTILQKLASLGVAVPKGALSYSTSRKGKVNWSTNPDTKISYPEPTIGNNTIHWYLGYMASVGDSADADSEFIDTVISEEQYAEMLAYGIAGTLGWSLGDKFLWHSAAE